ncbi:hypothetical protein [Actinokineospora pegani]|uniref:hypothetical protein n=1 Tax=Actinokineospora pegani TaxID=2654637 RepID=UPI0012EAA4B2|nr:hypothetical protein [Actinokineospora pegani]
MTCSRERRSFRTSAHRERKFVFEPKRTKVRVRDLRVRELVERLSGPDGVFARLPVTVLRDTSVPGLRLAARAEATPRPARARGMTAVRGQRYDPADPRKPLAVVGRAEPAHRQAAAPGFRTWPGQAR